MEGLDQQVPIENVDLDALNPKQRIKEYKATKKLLKSKEVFIKNQGLEKVKDFRYIYEGGCLPTLIESITPKKVLN
jgi:hypothetical protein